MCVCACIHTHTHIRTQTHMAFFKWQQAYLKYIYLIIQCICASSSLMHVCVRVCV